MERKLTDEEVITELKSASKWFVEHGRNTNTAIIGICDRAVDLINRQKAQNERDVKAKVEALYKVNDLKLENERQKAEIERKKEYCTKCAERTTKAMIGLQETLGTARAEAIKEFAELVKLEFYREFDELIPSIMADKIDNLVEEMTVRK